MCKYNTLINAKHPLKFLWKKLIYLSRAREFAQIIGLNYRFNLIQELALTLLARQSA